VFGNGIRILLFSFVHSFCFWTHTNPFSFYSAFTLLQCWPTLIPCPLRCFTTGHWSACETYCPMSMYCNGINGTAKRTNTLQFNMLIPLDCFFLPRLHLCATIAAVLYVLSLSTRTCWLMVEQGAFPLLDLILTEAQGCKNKGEFFCCVSHVFDAFVFFYCLVFGAKLEIALLSILMRCF
jgi:hypothetical protein